MPVNVHNGHNESAADCKAVQPVQDWTCPFLGAVFPYPGEGIGWGSFFVVNERRSIRRLPSNGDCPFASLVAGSNPDRPANRIYLAGSKASYWVTPNINPITGFHWIVFPDREHREHLEAPDVELIGAILQGGFANLICEHIAGREPLLDRFVPDTWTAYCNPMPGSGRSLLRLHIGLVPARGLTLPVITPALWPVCRGAGDALILAAGGFTFPALTVQGPTIEEIAETVERLDIHFRDAGLAYNLLAFPEGIHGSLGSVFVLVPRAEEYCDAADQKVAGLELLTGVLIPGPARREGMSSGRRDEAFRQATLDSERWHQLVRDLRAVFGLSTPGTAVFVTAR
jgi:hypothetical protein